MPGISQFKGGSPSFPGIAQSEGGRPSSLGITPSRRGQPSSLGITPSKGGPPSSLGISQFKGGSPSFPGIAQSEGGRPLPGSIVQISGGETPALGVPQARGMQSPPWGIVQMSGGETPALGVPQARGMQSPPWSQVQVAGGETPALGVPQTPRGTQVPVPVKASTPAPSGVSLPARKRVEKDKSPLQKRATLLYFLTVVVVIIIGTFAGLHAAGISPSSLLPHAAKPPAVTYPLPNVNPLFADSFINDASGWNLQSSPGNYTVNVGNGVLTMETSKNKLFWEPLPGLISYSDFTLTINAALTKGDQNNGYGLYIRGTAGQGSDMNTYYRFELYGDGSYAIFKGAVDQNGNPTATKIVKYTLSPAIQKQGKSNHIMIFARGASMSFIVNGQLLKTFTDTSYTAGSIALFASNLAEAKPGMQVQFSQFAIYPSYASKAS
ncbi:MAG: DUF1080 domain-containing protein [Ktedonobacteraceae bacterium]|nr:DUF1080 domain-containing protein [Ktedonobacteraceae bacterium]